MIYKGFFIECESFALTLAFAIELTAFAYIPDINNSIFLSEKIVDGENFCHMTTHGHRFHGWSGSTGNPSESQRPINLSLPLFANPLSLAVFDEWHRLQRLCRFSSE